MSAGRASSVPFLLVLGLVLAACAGSGATGSASGSSPAAAAPSATADGSAPIVVEHALGATTIEAAPERVATVQWANHEVPLALGVVPVGMAAANFADPDGDGLLPWVADRLDELDADVPVLFDENDGIPFEAVAGTDPDVILASYSGLTQEDHDTLTEIAPTVAYPDAPWATPWREMIEVNSTAMGMADEGADLVADLERQIDEAVADHPDLAGTTTLFLTHVDPSDLSEIGFYTANDTRVQFFGDIGLATPEAVAEASRSGDAFFTTVSAEQADRFADVELIVTYGDDRLLDALQADPLLGRIPAVEDGAVAFFAEDDPVSAALNPTPLAIPATIDEVLDRIDAVAGGAGARTEPSSAATG